MNRDKLIRAIETCHPKLKGEIMYHLEDADHEDEDYDIVDAFEDAMNIIEEYASEDKELMNHLKNLFIEIGYAVPVSKEALDKTFTTSGKKYWFKKNGIYYDMIDSWKQWIKK